MMSKSSCGTAVVKGTLRALARLLFRVRVHGNAGEFANARTLIVANHESFLDGLLLGIFLAVQATFVVHTTVVRNPLNAFLLRFIPHLAVDSTSPLAIEPVGGIANGGALHVKGPNVMKGYLLHDQPGVVQPPRSIDEGWYATGDIVEFDADDF